MPKGYRKDGYTTGRKDLHRHAPRQHKTGERADRFAPGELMNNPQLAKEILKLYLDEGWTAPSIVRHLQAKGESRVTVHTIYLLAKRMREKVARARAAGTPTPEIKRPGDMEVVPGAHTEIIPDEGKFVVADTDPTVVTHRARAFLAQQADKAQNILELALNRSYSAAMGADPAHLDTLLKAAGRATGLVRILSGVETAEKQQRQSSGHQHLHLHGGPDPFTTSTRN